MRCWKCNAEILQEAERKISFRELCDRCQAWLHCCKNCRNYKPGASNDCAIPGTEYVADREACNFCEDFKVLGEGPKKTLNPKDIAKRLFKD